LSCGYLCTDTVDIAIEAQTPTLVGVSSVWVSWTRWKPPASPGSPDIRGESCRLFGRTRSPLGAPGGDGSSDDPSWFCGLSWADARNGVAVAVDPSRRGHP